MEAYSDQLREYITIGTRRRGMQERDRVVTIIADRHRQALEELEVEAPEAVPEIADWLGAPP